MARLAVPAQFLLRIDDLCPTVHSRRWQRLRGLLEEFSLCPILAVIPINQDTELRVSPPDPAFWQQMCELQAAGATIAQHGYSHVCRGAAGGLVPLHRTGEFTGLPLEVQRQRIADGREVLIGQGLDPKLWVAPRHSFDANTLRALRHEGFRYLSDGFARRPLERGGMTWIPMQLWAPVARARGLWTICIHPNTLDRNQFERLRRFVQEYVEQFTSFDRVVREYGPAPPGPADRVFEVATTLRLRLRGFVRRRRHG